MTVGRKIWGASVLSIEQLAIPDSFTGYLAFLQLFFCFYGISSVELHGSVKNTCSSIPPDLCCSHTAAGMRDRKCVKPLLLLQSFQWLVDFFVLKVLVSIFCSVKKIIFFVYFERRTYQVSPCPWNFSQL